MWEGVASVGGHWVALLNLQDMLLLHIDVFVFVKMHVCAPSQTRVHGECASLCKSGQLSVSEWIWPWVSAFFVLVNVLT